MKINTIQNYLQYRNNCKICNTVNFSSLKEFKTGDSIENIGIVVDTMQIRNHITGNNDNCCLLYQKTDAGGVFKLLRYDYNAICLLSQQIGNSLQLRNALKKYNYYTMPAILERLKTISSETVELYDKIRIAECAYIRISKPQDKNILLAKGYKPFDNNDFIFIEDYYAKMQKEYPLASRITALSLLNALKKRKLTNVLTIAFPIGEHATSPVNLYLKAGFKPFKFSVDEIKKHKIKTPKGLRIDPKFIVPMGLSNDAYCYKLASKSSYTDKLDEIQPDWF